MNHSVLLMHLTVLSVSITGVYLVMLTRNLVRCLYRKLTQRRYRIQTTGTIPLSPAITRQSQFYGRTRPILDIPTLLQVNTKPMISMIAFVASCLLLLCSANAQQWSSFHNGGNTSVELANLPVNWSPEQGIAWKTDLRGYGQSAPVLWNDTIYLTTIEGERKEQLFLTAYSLSTGEQKWQAQANATVQQQNSAMVSRAAPTPVVDGQGIYAMFESGDLLCYTHDGQLQWQTAFFNTGDKSFQNNHGYGSSPTQTENAVVVLVDHAGPSYLVAIDKKTGNQLWKTERTSRSSWTSPQIARAADQWQVIVSSNGTVDGYDTANGTQLWSVDQISGNTICSVAIAGDLVFVGASEPRRRRGTNDTNDTPESATNCCLKIAPGSDAGYEMLWKSEKAVCDYVSPFTYQGHAYYVNKLGIVRCVDIATGELVYEERMGEPCWAQPIACQDRIYFFGKSGRTVVIEAGPEYKVRAKNQLWAADSEAENSSDEQDAQNAGQRGNSPSNSLDPLVYSAIASDDTIVVRLGNELICIRSEDSSGPQTLSSN